jgi:hypothetical protein
VITDSTHRDRRAGASGASSKNAVGDRPIPV